MKTTNRTGFTLVELLVVIGILGVLVGVLIASLSGSTDSARAAQCLSNLRNLATACQTYGSTAGRYPLAGSIEYMKIDESQGMAHAKAAYYEIPGWISWASMGAYKNKPASHQSSASWMTSLYADNIEQNHYCITNGAVWRYLNNHDTYICPDHARKRKAQPPQWSYVMNAYFGWDSSKGSETQGESFSHVTYGNLNRADRILLFAEIPALSSTSKDVKKAHVQLPEPNLTGGNGDEKMCGCLRYKSLSGGGQGVIGFNHVRGKDIVGHVAFADGHVEALVAPKSGNFDDLTDWLCQGLDIVIQNKNYQKVNNSEVQ